MTFQSCRQYPQVFLQLFIASSYFTIQKHLVSFENFINSQFILPIFLVDYFGDAIVIGP